MVAAIADRLNSRSPPHWTRWWNAIVRSVLKKGCYIIDVSAEQFSLIKGQDQLRLYQFDSKEARHYFCTNCGIHPFSHPRSAPNMYSINVRCLDDFDLTTSSFELIHFDGKHWEQAVADLNKRLASME